MKIIRITTFLDFGGQEKKYISFSECKSLLKNDYVFAAIGHGGFAQKTIQANGFRVEVFNQNPSIYNLKNIWMLYKWFRKEKPDVVHTAAAEANFHGVIAARLAGVKVVLAEEIGFPNHSPLARKVFGFVYKFVKKVICVSKSVKGFLIEIKEIDANKGVVVYNPVSVPKFFEKITPEDFTIVCVGRLEKVKNQQLLIKAFSELENKKSKLILVGDGRERSALETLIKELQLEDRVIITGFSKEPEFFLAQAHLFVLSSLTEGFGIAVVEAMQQGLPCLCSNVGGIPEFIEEGKTGWLFNPNNEGELAEKLKTIANLPLSELEKVGSTAKTFTADRFTSEKYVINLENLYQESL
ncbi:glycosyltransferase [Flavobacterium sp. SM15]|uniref:glycosyltransferase n=1 Tax=Flavobacterium sp. SM15 TaxID=2908005 RepID=UPI001EDA496E|nr:glycosyltransferase [Flavobacterium sp. SM15]MCG2611287.1 glycosyltransferase [Flavobacterium sp. SM15]